MMVMGREEVALGRLPLLIVRVLILYTMCTVSMNNIFARWHHMSVTERVEHLLLVAYAIGLLQHSPSNGRKSHIFNMFLMLWAR